MKPSFLNWFLCLGILVASLWEIETLQASGAGSPDIAQSRVANSCTPELKQRAGILEATFCYHDFAESLHRFSCPIDANFAYQEEMSFGYPVGEPALAELDRRLVETLDKAVGPLARYVSLKVAHTSVAPTTPRYHILWEYRLEKFQWDAELPDVQREEAFNVEKRIRQDLKSFGHQVYLDYLRERGFDFRPTGDPRRGFLDIAYKRLADRARPMLADCFDRFIREAGASDQEEILQLLLASFQELTFQRPSAEEDGVYQAEFWVPTRVLRCASGDCDSKATALCSLWQNARPQIILFVIQIPEDEKQKIPPGMQADEHVLLGIEAYPGVNQATVPVGNRQYVLSEVVRPLAPGFGKILPGKTLFSVIPNSGFCMTEDCQGTQGTHP